MESVLVTGANRGIGLELVKQLVELAKPPVYVFATYRDESTLKNLKEIQEKSKQTQVFLIKMDIAEVSDIERARKLIEEKVGEKGLNLLINNAGVLKYQGFPEITEENMLFHFQTNTVGPVLVLKEMLPLLQKAGSHGVGRLSGPKAIALNMSGLMASITELTEEKPVEFLSALSYRTSKAALNMAMRVAALTVKDQGVLVVNMCPGWVKTDMGTEQGLLTPQESVSAILQTLPQLNESHRGCFVDRNGKTIPF